MTERFVPAGASQSYSKNALMSRYRHSARRRGFEYALTEDELLDLWQKPCTYCGKEMVTIGIDRVDSSIGYQPGNVVSCCNQCNMAKGQMLPTEFVEYCRLVVSHYENGQTGVKP